LTTSAHTTRSIRENRTPRWPLHVQVPLILHCSECQGRSRPAQDVSQDTNLENFSPDEPNRSCCKNQGKFSHDFEFLELLTSKSVMESCQHVQLARSQEEEASVRVPMISLQRAKKEGQALAPRSSIDGRLTVSSAMLHH
jgi:hypothetical protein